MIDSTLLEALRAALPAHLTVAEDPELMDDTDEHEAVRVSGPGDFTIGVTTDLEWGDDDGEPVQVFTLWSTPEPMTTALFDSLVTWVEGHAREWFLGNREK